MSRDELRRDRAANLAVLCGIGSGIALTVAAISMAAPSGYPGRSDPFYWLLMVPVAIWAWAAVDFRPWALRLLPVVLIAVPPVAAMIALVWPGLDRADLVTFWVVGGIGAVLGMGGWRWRARSALRHR